MTVQRLRSSSDVRAVFATRTAAACPAAVVHMRSRGYAAEPRITVVAGKKVGNAVARNRAKRRLRAVVPALPMPPGRDYVVVARPPALQAAFSDLEAQLRQTFQKLEDRR